MTTENMALIPISEVKAEEKGKPEQLEFFSRALLRISTKEDQRALESIVKECLSLSVRDTTIREMIKLMAIDNPDIKDAAEKIDKL